MIELRPYQLEGVEASRRAISLGTRRILFVLPTGGGKTVVASYIIARALERGRPALFVAHRRELIFQTVRKLVALGVPHNKVSFILGNERYVKLDDGRVVLRNPQAPVQVASLDTLRNRTFPEADLVFIDEAHRALASSYQRVCDAYPTAVILGLTATPFRADNKSLGAQFDDLITISKPSQLIAEGFLCAPRVFTRPQSALPDLTGVHMSGGDYNRDELAIATDDAKLVGDIVDHWQQRAENRRTVVFAVNVKHSKHITERFREAGIAAEHLDGETDSVDRDAILKRLELGETRVVVNCGVLCEGWDMPSVKVCVLARPTKSTGLYLQQAGRILRPYTDPEIRRAVDAIILDHAGCAIEHGLPQEDREFELNPPPRRRKKNLAGPPCKACPQCFAIVLSITRICPDCGFEFPAPAGDTLDEAFGELVELTPETMAKKRAAWDEICREALVVSRRPNKWAKETYIQIFGVAPPKHFPAAWKRPEREYSDREKRSVFDGFVREGVTKGFKPSYATARYRSKFKEFPPDEWTNGSQELAAEEESIPWAM